MTELHENKLKRLIMQSNRRGMKENDIILGDFAKNNIGKLNFDELDEYEKLLIENDQDIYLWIS
ncbi:MAG: succinate dehydrogenase assembly factor 2, partial [Paracoccaceae bacterium]|nr:succinate dehydrogenase assembly factor 2 [Paracoccaceae bacterium]